MTDSPLRMKEHPKTEVLKNPVFVEFFENLIQEKQVVEYYLLDAMGNFLFLSDTGKASALFVFNEDTLESQEDRVPEKDRHPDVLEDIYNHRKAICFYPFNTHEKYDPENWKQYLQPLAPLEDNKTIFTAFVSDITNLDQRKIVSFKDYISQLGK